MKNNIINKFIAVVIMISMMSSVSFAHSGRTDGSGGHNDNNNKSGLGSYHYHHGYGPHLHTDGICPYETSSDNTSSVKEDETIFLSVQIPRFDVKVNGELIDTKHSQYPILSYKSVTYFPMTSDYLSGIGLSLSFSNEDGLKINTMDDITTLEQKFLEGDNILGSWHDARLAPFDIAVNDKIINNIEEEYPILLYKDITYFPMTWRFAVEEFKWKTKWSNETGFEIIIEK